MGRGAKFFGPRGQIWPGGHSLSTPAVQYARPVPSAGVEAARALATFEPSDGGGVEQITDRPAANAFAANSTSSQQIDNFALYKIDRVPGAFGEAAIERTKRVLATNYGISSSSLSYKMCWSVSRKPDSFKEISLVLTFIKPQYILPLR